MPRSEDAHNTLSDNDAVEASFFMPEMSDAEQESSWRRYRRVLGLFAAVEADKQQGSDIIKE